MERVTMVDGRQVDFVMRKIDLFIIRIITCTTDMGIIHL